MFFEEKFIFVICFIAVGIFALIMLWDNTRLTVKNAKLRKENKKLKRKISVYEKQKAKDQEQLRPYFDDVKGRLVDPKKCIKK